MPYKGDNNVDIAKELPTVIAFCAGYGGVERGLDLAGFEHRVIAYVEIEAFAIANLVSKMESGQLSPAPIYTDLKTFPAHLFRDRVDIITGGYPCQPFSAAGKRLGEDDPRHLWPFIRRHVQTIRPSRVFFENVEGHISLGLSTVISDLEEDGYRSAWGIFSAREVGAPHQRKRVYIMGNSKHDGPSSAEVRGGACSTSNNTAQRQDAASKFAGAGQPKSGVDISNQLADTICSRSATGIPGSERPNQEGIAGITDNCSSEQSGREIGVHWPPEPRVGRVVDGCADRVDRIRLLGNGVVPQTAAKAWDILSTRLN